MHHDDRSGRAELDGEIAIRDGVERILRNGFKAEQLSGVFAIDRVGRAGKCSGAERARIDAAAQIEEALAVTLEHFRVGEHVVAERYGLGNLHVGKARHDRVPVLAGLRNEHFLQVLDAIDDFVDFAAQVEANVSCNLVVARTARMQALAGVADKRGETRFNVEMHVFEFKLPLERAGKDFFANLRHAAADVLQVLFGDHADLGQHGSVSERTFDVDERHALVEVNARGIAKNESIDGFGEAARPGLFLGMQGVVGVVLRLAHCAPLGNKD